MTFFYSEIYEAFISLGLKKGDEGILEGHKENLTSLIITIKWLKRETVEPFSFSLYLFSFSYFYVLETNFHRWHWDQ